MKTLSISPSAAARRILWPTVMGPRAQRKRKVNILIRLGYKTPPKDFADEIKRDFQVKALLRAAPLRCRHSRVLNQRVAIDIDESQFWSGIIITGATGSGKQGSAHESAV